jgi:hypothetical protein
MSLWPFYRATLHLGLLTVRRAATPTVDLGGLWLTGPTGASDVPRSHVFHWALLGEWGLWQPVIFGGLLTMRSSYRTEDDSPMWMWREGRFVSRSPRDLAPGWGASRVTDPRHDLRQRYLADSGPLFFPPFPPWQRQRTTAGAIWSAMCTRHHDSDRGKHVIYYRIV